MPDLRIALLTQVFPSHDDNTRLVDALEEARRREAELAVLPELPLDRWMAVERTPRDDDAEAPEGSRHRRLAAAASGAGLAVLGGAIVHDPKTGRRHNTALLFGADGSLLGATRKTHLPFEEGFWEAAHYEPGDEAPGLIEGLPMGLGVLTCSDANRTGLALMLRALGAGVILVPRATPRASWKRWRLVLRADAVTSASWFVSVNRPAGEVGADIGGPSVVIAPDGEVVLETEEPLALATLSVEAQDAARRDYPGYLDVRSELYAQAWARVRERS